MTCANGRTPPTCSPSCRHGWANRSTPQADATMAARNPWTALEGSENRSGHVGGTPIRGTRVRMPSHRMGYRYEGKGLRRPHGRRIYEPVREGRDRHQGRDFERFGAFVDNHLDFMCALTKARAWIPSAATGRSAHSSTHSTSSPQCPNHHRRHRKRTIFLPAYAIRPAR